MGTPPNLLYTAFSFIGFVMCMIPLYWHLEGMDHYSPHHGVQIIMYGTAWNVGTCLYMIWTGLGCLIQCINSIVWNNNMIDKAPIYCDIGNPLTRPVVP